MRDFSVGHNSPMHSLTGESTDELVCLRLIKKYDGQTANTMVCVEGSQRYVVILSNDVRSEAGFAELVRLVLGDTGVPYDWEYGATQESNELALSVAGKPCRQPAVAPTRQARTSRGASAYQLARSG
jgi:hypothetical protein